jgi:hypothetical protein
MEGYGFFGLASARFDLDKELDSTLVHRGLVVAKYPFCDIIPI